MALHIRDKEADRLVRELAERRGIPLTEAVVTAAREALERDAKSLDLWERLQPLLDRVAARGSTGFKADKAFYDSLNDE
jgi:antitoxin VapB